MKWRLTQNSFTREAITEAFPWKPEARAPSSCTRRTEEKDVHKKRHMVTKFKPTSNLYYIMRNNQLENLMSEKIPLMIKTTTTKNPEGQMS